MGDRAIDSPLPFLLQLKSRCVFSFLIPVLRESGPAVIKRRRNGKLKQGGSSPGVKPCVILNLLLFFLSLRGLTKAITLISFDPDVYDLRNVYHL